MEYSQECQAHKYRLQKINEIQTILNEELEKRTILSKKYHKWVKILGVSSLSFWDQYYNIAPYVCATKCD